MDEEIYMNIAYSLINGLKGQVNFEVANIDYGNIEIIISDNNINEGDFSISFQKQNGSFTIATKDNLDKNIKNKIIDIVNNFTKTELFASYNFTDMKDINVNHYVYDESKIKFNKDILNQLNDLKQIENLKINNLNNSDIITK